MHAQRDSFPDLHTVSPKSQDQGGDKQASRLQSYLPKGWYLASVSHANEPLGFDPPRLARFSHAKTWNSPGP